MQAAPGHDVGLASEDLGRPFLHVHQLVEPERSFRVIEEEIDIGTARASSRAVEPNK